MPHRLTVAFAAAAVMAAGCLGAEARTYHRYRGPYPYETPAPRAEYAPTNACMPICLGDNHPCDPIQYKQFDGRCGSRW